MEVNTANHISVQQAARTLGVSRQRIHQLLATGKLRGTRHELAKGARATWTVDANSVTEHQKEGHPEVA